MLAFGYASELLKMNEIERFAFWMADWPANLLRAAAWRCLAAGLRDGLGRRKSRMETGPIFIGGLANTGRQIAPHARSASASLFHTAHLYVARFYERFGDLGRPENLEKCLTAMLAHEPIRQLQPDLARIRAEFAQASPTYARLFGLFHAHHAVRMGKPRWGDQLGHVEQFAAPIFDAFPTARMIHMVRNPRHVYEEAMARHRRRKGKVGWTTADWLSSVGAGKENLARFAGRYKMVRYEALMAQPEQTVREICHFIDEDYHPEMLAAPVTNKPKNRPESRRRPPQPNARMSPGEVAFMRTYASRDLHALGYSLDGDKLSLRDWLLFLLVDWPANRAAMAAWRTANPDAMHRTPRYMKQ